MPCQVGNSSTAQAQADCKQAPNQQGSLINLRPSCNKIWSYSVALPHALDPPTCQSPPCQEQLYLGLKSALQGPKGARVCKQGGQPRACGREGWEELQERD